MNAIANPGELLEGRLRGDVRVFFSANININDDVALRDDDNIFGKGYVTSIFAIRLLEFVEDSAGITVADEDILLANFSSVDAIMSLVGKYRELA